jgi:hypothetical protein
MYLEHTDLDPCVIAYFPGAGGGRLARYLLGRAYDQNPQGHYHFSDAPPAPEINARFDREGLYLYQNTDIITSSEKLIELTHCMNTSLLKIHFPGRKIVKIKCSLEQALNRVWAVWSGLPNSGPNQRYRTVPKEQNSIEFHHRYYQSTGIDWQCDQLFDIDHNTDEFCVFMRQSMSQYTDTYYAQIQKQWLAEHCLDYDYNR